MAKKRTGGFCRVCEPIKIAGRTVPPTRAKSARRRFLLRHSTGHDSHTVRVSAPRKMLLLFETPAGFSLFKVKDEGKLDDAEVRRAPSL